MGRQHCHETNGLQAAREQSVEFIQNRCTIRDLNASSVAFLSSFTLGHNMENHTEIAISERLEKNSSRTSCHSLQDDAVLQHKYVNRR